MYSYLKNRMGCGYGSTQLIFWTSHSLPVLDGKVFGVFCLFVKEVFFVGVFCLFGFYFVTDSNDSNFH